MSCALSNWKVPAHHVIPAGGLASDFTMGELGVYISTGLGVAQAKLPSPIATPFEINKPNPYLLSCRPDRISQQAGPSWSLRFSLPLIASSDLWQTFGYTSLRDTQDVSGEKFASHKLAFHRFVSHRLVSHRLASHRLTFHRFASHRLVSHRLASHRLTFHRFASHRLVSHRLALHRLVSHRLASHRLAFHRFASHRLVSHRLASHKLAFHRLASHRLVSDRFVSHRLASPAGRG